MLKFGKFWELYQGILGRYSAGDMYSWGFFLIYRFLSIYTHFGYVLSTISLTEKIILRYFNQINILIPILIYSII
jgi:hypothetical protein